MILPSLAAAEEEVGVDAAGGGEGEGGGGEVIAGCAGGGEADGLTRLRFLMTVRPPSLTAVVEEDDGEGAGTCGVAVGLVGLGAAIAGGVAAVVAAAVVGVADFGVLFV